MQLGPLMDRESARSKILHILWNNASRLYLLDPATILVAKQLMIPVEMCSHGIVVTFCNTLMNIEGIHTDNQTNRVIPACVVYGVSEMQHFGYW